MQQMTASEYAKKLSETTEDVKDLQTQYFNAGKAFAIKHVLDQYNMVKDNYKDLEGLTYAAIEAMFDDCIKNLFAEVLNG